MATAVSVDETAYGGWLVANAGEWLPRAVAAVRLGISDRTLARRIASGALIKRVTNGTTEIYVTDTAQQQTDQGVIRILVQRHQELAEEVGRLKEENRRLKTDLSEHADRFAISGPDTAEAIQDIMSNVFGAVIIQAPERYPFPAWHAYDDTGFSNADADCDDYASYDKYTQALRDYLISMDDGKIKDLFVLLMTVSRMCASLGRSPTQT